MNEIDEDMMKAVIAAINLAGDAWVCCEDEIAATDLIKELAVLGYKIVKDGA